MEFRFGPIMDKRFDHLRIDSFRIVHCLRLFMLIWLLGMSGIVQAQTYDENHLVQASQGTGEGVILIDLQNLNAPDPLLPPVPVYRTLVAPSDAVPEIEILSYRLVASENEKPLGEFDKKEFESEFGAIQDPFVSYSPIGLFRNYQLGKLAFAPRVKVHLGARLVLVEMIELQAKIAFPTMLATDSTGDDPLGRRIIDVLAINPDASPVALELTKGNVIAEEINVASRWAKSLEEGIKSGGVARLEVKQDGIFVLSSDELTSAGLNAVSFSPERMRLFENGKELNIAVLDQSESNWKIAFASVPFSPYEVASRSYFLFADLPSMQRPPRRSAPQSIEPSGGAEVTIGRGSIILQERAAYLHKIPIDGKFSHWYWMDIPRNEFKSISVEMPDLNPEGEDVLVRLYLSVAERDVESQCRIYVNGTESEAVSWTGFKGKVNEFKVPAKQWKRGVNDLVVEFPAQSLKAPAKAIYLSRCEIEYPQTLTAKKDFLRTRARLTGQNVVTVQGDFSGGFLADVTNPAWLQIYDLAQAQDAGRFFTNVKGNGDRLLVAFTPNSANRVASTTPVSHDGLLIDHAADAQDLIIAPSSSVKILQPLLDYRRKQGESIEAVALEDVFLQFGFGNQYPKAIRSFLRAVYFENETPRLSSVLLIGESSDVEGREGEWPAETNEDQMPVYWEQKPTPEPRSDFPYSLMTPNDDLPDISVGRIPAITNEGLAKVVEKIIHYETSQQSGLWRSRNLFITDDEPVFQRIADDLKFASIPGQFQTVNVKQADYPYVHSFEGGDIKWSPEAAQEVLRRFNEGALTTFFIGHGGPNIFSHERLFHIDEMPEIANAGAPTMLAVASCDSAWLDYPLPPGKFSLSELFIMHPDGGAIGVYAPTSAATPPEHQQLLEPYFAGVFRHKLQRMGDAVLYSMLRFKSGVGGNVHQQYVLLGDPLTRLAPPPRDISVFASPGMHVLKSASTIKITANWPGVREGKALIALRVSGKDNDIIAQDVPIRNGRLQYEWNVPSDLPEGHHMISVYGQGGDGKREALGEADFEVAREAFQLILDQDLVNPTVRKAGEDVNVKFSLENRLPTEAKDVTLLVRAVGSSAQALEQKINLAPRERLQREMTVKMSEGVKALDYFVYGPGRNPEATETWERARLVFPVLRPKSTTYHLDTLGDLIAISPRDLPPDAPLKFQVPIWNLGSKDSPNLVVTLQDETGKQLGKTVELNGLTPGERAMIEFIEPKGLPPGRRRVTVSVRVAGSEKTFQPPVLTADRIVQIDPHSDLEFVAGSIRFDSKEFIDGQTIYIDADVKNIGGRQSQPSTVEAYKGTERIEENRIMSSFGTKYVDVPALKPGATHHVRLRWDHLHTVGTHKIRLLVNPDQVIPENDFDNNWIDGQVTIHPLGNIFVVDRKLTASPSIAKPGEKVRLDARIRSDKKQDLSEMRVALFAGRDVKSQKMIGNPIRPAKGAQDEIPVTFEVVAERDSHTFAIDANYRRLVAETVPDDNRAQATINLLLPLDDLKKSGTAYDLLPDVEAGQMQSVRIGPSGGLTCDDFSSASGRSHPMAPNLINGQYTTREGQATLTDGKWLLTDGRVESSPREGAPPLTVTVPPPDVPAKAYNVFATIETNVNYRNEGPASQIEIKLPGADSPETFDFFEAKPWNQMRYAIGRAASTGKALQFEIGHPKGKYWTVLHKLELVPLTGIFSSPLIDLSSVKQGAKIHVLTKATVPDDAGVKFQVIFGAIDAQGMPQWTEWQDIASNDATIPVTGNLMQIRAYLMAGMRGVPVVDQLGFEIVQ